MQQFYGSHSTRVPIEISKNLELQRNPPIIFHDVISTGLIPSPEIWRNYEKQKDYICPKGADTNGPIGVHCKKKNKLKKDKRKKRVKLDGTTQSVRIDLRCETRAESYREKFRARVPYYWHILAIYSVRAILYRSGRAIPLTRSTASGDNEFRFSLVGQTRRIRRLGCYRLTRPRPITLDRLARTEYIAAISERTAWRAIINRYL